jgi:O-antigen ligase
MHPIYRSICWTLWGLVLVSIPFTSLPILSIRTRLWSAASPMAAIPLFALILLWYLPRKIRRPTVPRLSLPLAGFLLVVLISAVAALFLDTRSFLGLEVLQREVRALISLAVGVAFYFVASEFPRREGAMLWTLRLVYLGCVVMLVWSAVQATLILLQVDPTPTDVRDFHRLFVSRDMSDRRVTGWAYEPSWLADQLLLVYLPLTAASVLRGFSAFTRRKTRISPELGLLVACLFIFFMTQSRIGLLALLLLTTTLGLWGTWHLAGRWAAGLRGGVDSAWLVRRRQAGIWLAALFVLGAAALGVVFLASRYDPRLGRLFGAEFVQAVRDGESAYSLANRLAYAERVMYWVSAFRTFALLPWLGSGLGNSGFTFLKVLPAYGYALPELIRVVNGAPGFPNAKNLWIRLLAETGIVGFLFFAAWLVLVGGAALSLIRTSAGVRACIGLAALLALGALAVEGFSLDTFALPQLWLLPALVTAAIRLHPESGK